MFKIEERNDKFFVIPTAEHLLNNFDRFSFPYDSNWEIYKLFNMPAEDFLKYIISAFNAHVIFQYEFPWVQFYFYKYTEAEFFKNELENRVAALEKN